MAQQQISKKINAVLARIEGDDDDEQHAEAIKSMHKALMKIMTEAVAEAVAEAEAKAKAEAPAKAPAKVVTKSKSGSGSGGKKRGPSVNNNIGSIIAGIKKGEQGFEAFAETVVTVTPTFSPDAVKSREKYLAYADKLPEGTQLTFKELVDHTREYSGESNPLINACLVCAMLAPEVRAKFSEDFRIIRGLE
jgi:hypothetical protein